MADLDEPDRMDAVFLTEQGRLALDAGEGLRAYELFSKAHAIVVRAFGPSSGESGTSRIYLAEALYEVDRFADARAAINQALGIYEQLERTDPMRDELEQVLIDICKRQGHTFEVERIHKARLDRARDGAPSATELARAADQGKLAVLYLEQGRYREASTLLLQLLPVLEQIDGPSGRETGLCCSYLAQVSLRTRQFSDAEAYGRRALECARASASDDPLAAAIAADELAVTLAYCATEDKDAAKAAESLRLSEGALNTFRAVEGPEGKEASRTAVNNYKLKEMLGTLLGLAPASSDDAANLPVPLPTNPFVSHSYQDRRSVELLRQSLPEYVKPVIFEPITAAPTEAISDNLISGVLGADGFIAIDSPTSNSSFWTAFERDLAARNGKRMYRFDPEARTFTRYRVNPRKLWIPSIYHPDDVNDVDKIIRWLVDKRSFESFETKEGAGELGPLSEMEPGRRERYLFSLRTYGAVYLVFLSRNFVSDDNLLRHAFTQAVEHPGATMFCWLDRIEDLEAVAMIEQLQRAPRETTYALSTRPTDPAFNAHELDDLMVRLYWLLYQGRVGDWSR
ncbi:MAG TPA: tetratricopeptide repeat protein [Vicinamibacterales bacterium]|nr:tetratricopeptide repeat protein [Vicinamibacterales bacterium]